MKIECPNCSQHYDISEEFFGQELECKICKKVFKVEVEVKGDDEENEKKHDLTATMKISKNNVWKNWK
ncbi:MAG: zinc-ribbon domain-containing protein [Victivallales bacterium]|nr:zinc-ribbon domain-containing protein [Victivallales bacterium]